MCKKIRISFICAAGIAALFSTATGHAAMTGTVTVTGAVPLACAIVVTGAPGAANIADISTGDMDLQIATVTETCNDPDGYTVTIAGTNSGAHTGLFKDPISNDTHPFTLSYNGVAVQAGGIVTNASAPGVDLNKAVRISYGTDSTLASTAGFSYAETLTFTIATK